MNCNKCGNPLPSDSDFCQYCGAAVIPAVEEAVVAPVTPVPESTTTSNEQPTFAPSTTSKEENSSTKGRYCKHCGGVISLETKKCDSCGKQYFRLPKRIRTIGIAAVAILLAGLNVFQYINHSQAAATITDLNDKIASLEKELSSKSITITSLNNKITSLEADVERYQERWAEEFGKIAFMDNYVVIVCDDGTNKYHKYECEDVNLSSFWAYNIENAIYQGYRACSKCN